MAVIEGIGIVIGCIVGAGLLVTIVFELFDGMTTPPKRQQGRIVHRMSDAHNEISDVFAAAREKMNRRAGLDSSFNLRSDPRNWW